MINMHVLLHFQVLFNDTLSLSETVYVILVCFLVLIFSGVKVLHFACTVSPTLPYLHPPLNPPLFSNPVL